MWFSGMSNGGGHEAVEEEEQTFHSAFRAMEKNLDDNITMEAIKVYMVLCRNYSLQVLALNLELYEEI